MRITLVSPMPRLNEFFDKNGLSQFFFLIEMNERRNKFYLIQTNLQVYKKRRQMFDLTKLIFFIGNGECLICFIKKEGGEGVMI